ncbi:MAG: WhiB family transcriptional regulator [Acidimicrobiales bacterium]|nr:WhiB family transcriptional regulator [Acidimicrobiales bacterium]
MLARLETRHVEHHDIEQTGSHEAEFDVIDAGVRAGDRPVLDLALEVDTSFWTDAACADDDGSLVRLFFSEELADIAAAKRICATCPVMEQCLEGALARKEPLGVWGGQLFQSGRILMAKRRRGRPPKNPRPEDEFVHVEVPVALRPRVERRIA